MQKFPARLARSPNNHLPCPAYFSLVCLAQQRGQGVRSLKIEIITRAVKIGRHGRDEIRPILARESLTQFYTGNLGNRVRFVGWFKRPAQERALWNWLRSKFRIDARTAEKQEFARPGLLRGANDVVLNL